MLVNELEARSILCPVLTPKEAAAPVSQVAQLYERKALQVATVPIHSLLIKVMQAGGSDERLALYNNADGSTDGWMGDLDVSYTGDMDLHLIPFTAGLFVILRGTGLEGAMLAITYVIAAPAELANEIYCRGSGCMWWRWGHNKPDERRVGFCGAAGSATLR